MVGLKHSLDGKFVVFSKQRERQVRCRCWTRNKTLSQLFSRLSLSLSLSLCVCVCVLLRYCVIKFFQL